MPRFDEIGLMLPSGERACLFLSRSIKQRSQESSQVTKLGRAHPAGKQHWRTTIKPDLIRRPTAPTLHPSGLISWPSDCPVSNFSAELHWLLELTPGIFRLQVAIRGNGIYAKIRS